MPCCPPAAVAVARLTLYESSISSRFKFSPEIQTAATFDFCNSIPSLSDIARQTGNFGKMPKGFQGSTQGWLCAQQERT
jgi:hypothetical protein